MKDDIARLREMSEDTLRVLDVAKEMVNSTYQRLCGLLHEKTEENHRLRQRILELEALISDAKSNDTIVDFRPDETTEIETRLTAFAANQQIESGDMAETLDIK